VLVPAQNFPTKDGWIVVFCNKDKFWQELVEALEAPEIGADPRFRTFPDRHAHRALLLPLLKARFATRTSADWLDRLRGRVPCAPVNDVRQALADEQVRARDMIVEVPHPEFGTLKEVRSPIRTEGEVRNPRRAPKLGEDTDAILGDILGYSASTIAGLRARGVLGAPSAPTR
jgi:crotonobetainyl-CoA:carnitine CoA-transferase CaiB-like acyl-CoA transferase